MGIVLLAALAACASGRPPKAKPLKARLPGSYSTATAYAWTGEFRPLGGAGITTRKNRVNGTITITSAAGDTTLSQVQLEITSGSPGGLTVSGMGWGIYPGRCGQGSALGTPFVPPNSLPRLDQMQNGSAQINTRIPVIMPVDGTYHVNVFYGTPTPDMSQVMACANLKLI